MKHRKKKQYHSGSFKVQVKEYLSEHRLSCYATEVHFNLTKSLVQVWDHGCVGEGLDSIFEDRRGRKMDLKRSGRHPKMTRQVRENYDTLINQDKKMPEV
ncbi:MAG: hypothetical protein CVV48_04685 [Spirochaetae bacterium HGW-Spirochaetae-4]|nr:MAG: hypothetical protein CVV48_04685 [Spirochaetae bacterium HGW-Spirochaetae-4]